MTSMLTTRAALNSGDSVAYGSGLRIGAYRGLRTISHGGSGGGDYILLRFPDQRWTTAVLCNLYQGATTSSALAYQVADLYLERTFAPVPTIAADTLTTPVRVPESELARYAGVYGHVSDRFERVEFVIHNGALAEVYDSVPHATVALGGGRFREDPFTFTFTSPTPGGPMHLAVARTGYSGEYIRDTTPQWHPRVQDLAAFGGTYQSSELDAIWTFRMVHDSLTLWRERYPARVVVPIERDTFVLTDPFEDGPMTGVLTFERDARGTINAFRLSEDRIIGLKFTKKFLSHETQ
jgi:hypothetical protein